MHSFHIRVFQHEVELQCKLVLLGAEQLADAEALWRRPVTRETWYSDPTIRPDYYIPRIWAALQSLLVAAANLSKLLWGSKGDALERERAPLRASLNVGDDSYLRSRDLRNDFEHFDERIDTAFQQGQRIIMGRNVGGGSTGGVPQFGDYDPESGMVTFWTHSVSVPAVVAEAKRILATVEQERMKPL